jgi:hypothetical protein
MGGVRYVSERLRGGKGRLIEDVRGGLNCIILSSSSPVRGSKPYIIVRN